MIGFNQQPVQRVTALGRNFPPDPEAHQNGNDDNGQRGCACHGVRFGKGQRTKQSPFLTFEGKNRDER